MDIAATDISAVAHRLGVTRDAVVLARSADVIDLHLDTFIPVRLYGYDPSRRHGLGPTNGRFFGHLDLPRALDAGLSGGMWSITTNPFRTPAGRWRTFERNLARLESWIQRQPGLVRARTHAEYVAARQAGKHACLISVQGGNCFDAAPASIASVPDRSVVRVTVLHLTHSRLGATSTPLPSLRRSKGLTAEGRAFVEALNAERVFVDLAHIHPQGFWDAVETHDKTQPLIDTHTGVRAVTPVWRNLDDDQLKAIADTGGTIGVIFAEHFLRRRGGPRDGRLVLAHLQHIIDVVGEDHASIGSDFDGAIVPPADLRSGDAYPRLVQHMLDGGWSDDRIRKVLGGNFLRAFRDLRP